MMSPLNRLSVLVCMEIYYDSIEICLYEKQCQTFYKKSYIFLTIIILYLGDLIFILY